MWSGVTGPCTPKGSCLRHPPLPPLAHTLTFLPIHLLTGFMRKEEKKPLRYITSGMVAMNFCQGRVGMGVSGPASWAWGPLP